LDDLSYDYTDVLQQTLSHSSLLPENLTIIPRVKNWRLHLDALVITDAGNMYDALFLAARAALWDTKVPQTRPIEYKAPSSREVGKYGQAGAQDMDVDAGVSSGLDTRNVASTADFELLDYWDEGESLKGRDRWPVCVTMNLVRIFLSHQHDTKTI
jgi:exosome complex component RRP42